ncbi:MAG: trigger factor [Elusimicrobia bacterium RIFCSPLOWO2_01_FULL_59_12]|nr:MAG: trigger factor [Elusimicrobia bacterium RIFCSPLOWO2_01_FULL_59_12]
METLEKPLSVKVKVLKEESCELTLSVELPAEEVARETESVFRDIQARASLPGFRTGKAPLDLVRKNFAQRARQTVLENLIGRGAAQVLRERKLQTIDAPKVEKIGFEPGKPLLFQMKVEKDPDLKVKDYKGLKITLKASPVNDDQVTQTLEELRERNATLVQASGVTVGKNHFLVVDFEGRIEGKAFPGGSAKNYLLNMAAPQTIAGFSEGLLDAGLSDVRTVTPRFPEDYPRKEFAGKDATFQVTIKEIKEKRFPALDDEFAKDLGLASLEELKQKVRQNLEKEVAERSDKELEDQIFQALLDRHSFSVPPTLVEHRTQALIRRTKNALERQGLMQPNDPKADAALRERVRPQAEKDVRLSYLLKAIASQEKLENVEADIDALKKKALEETQDKKETVETYFKDHLLSIRASLIEAKVIEFLKKNAKIK